MNYVKSFDLFGVPATQIPATPGSGAPTTATEGAVGCLYMDTDTGNLYKCTAVTDGVYTWVEAGNGSGSGLSTTAANLLIEILRHVHQYEGDQSGNITALAAELGVTEEDEPDTPVEPDEPVTPEVTLSSISATYSGGDVAVGTSVTDLTGIVVTATYSDGSTATVTDYTLSGTIAEGSNTITVIYGGKTTTFTVTGVAESGGEPVEMLASVLVVNGTNFNWYTDEGTTAYSGNITNRSAPPAIASSNIFDTDTTVVVNLNSTSQTYDYFVVASTDWDGVTTTAIEGGYNNFNCVETGVKSWSGSGVNHQITYAVKAGKRLVIFGYAGNFDHISISVEVV